MTTVQNRKKLALKFYNYSMLDQLDRPLEYRINRQMRARSAEVMYVSNQTDFAFEPLSIGHKVVSEVLPFPSLVKPIESPDDISYVVRVATPYEEFNAMWIEDWLGEYRGALFEACMGGYLIGRLNRYEAARRDGLNQIRDRIQMTWAKELDILLSNQSISYMRFWAENARITEAFERILAVIPNNDFITIKMDGQFTFRRRIANANMFYLAHKSNVKQIYLELEKINGC